MKFTSTRSDVEVDSLYTVLRGLAADGGLYVPARVPCLDTSAISSMRSFWGLSPPQFPSSERCSVSTARSERGA